MINNKILRKDNIQEILSLSPTQQGLLFKYQMDPKSSEYMEQVVLKIKGDITDKEIERVWHHLISTYDGLRSIYKWEKLSNPVQIVLKEIDLPLYFEERVGDCTTILNEIRDNELKKGIDLTTEPLRIRLVNGANHEKIMILTYHHILWDGWSSGILIDSFTRLCNEIEVDKELPSKIKVTPWREYIKLVRNRDIDGEKKYWANYLDGVERNEISPQSTHNKHIDNKSHRETFYIEDNDYKILKNACIQNKHTLAGWIHSGLGILLQIHSNHNDIIFGSTVSGRNVNLPNVEHMIGLFINTLPIRVIKNTDTKVFELIRHVEKSMNERSPYETTPLSSIKEYCGFKGEEGLFDTILVFENYPLNLDRNSKVDIDVISISEDTHFGLTIMVMEKNNKLEFILNYKCNKFSQEWIRYFMKLLYKVILKMVNYYYDKVINIDLLDEEEKHQLLAQYKKSEYSNDELIMERFESHAASHPDKIALIYENQTMTYRELNEEANQLARYFIDHGVKKESVVGIKMNRSIDMMVVIFGILKSGASYLPIGIDTPQARIDYMLLDSECKLLITDQANEMASSHESADFQCILYGHIRDFLQDYEKTNHKIEDIRKSKAYIIYTSGSTGQPKGVVVEHDALTERMNWFHVKYMREETSRILLKTAITFDVSITELFGWIGCQGQLVVLPEGEEKNSAKIRETVIRYNVTDLNFTPSAFKVMGNELQNVASIQRIYLAGEALTKDVVQEAFRINSTLEVFNLYGPTETVIYATGTKIEKESPSITIGKPIDNVSVYILDSNQQLCPVGIIGELYISGNSLARGYLNNPELTAERFIENPYAANQRMYKTGDLVRWTHDGHIEYLGRIDHQVKIRGYRIELGEIESSISEQEGVKEVVVLNRKDASGMDYLCAYVVKEEATAIEKIKEGISQELPHYMVPGAFVEIDAIPITANGKVNRARLLEMEVTFTRENGYQEATNELEEKLVAIWEDALGVERIGIHDNFFEVGGHSLKATIVSGRIQKEVEVEIGVRDVFQYPTIKELATKISKSHQKKYEKLVPLSKQESYPVSSAQRRLYTIQMMDKGNVVYNMPFALTLTGQVERVKVEQAIQQLVVKHESLRTSFHIEGEEIVQKIADKGTLTLAYKEAESQAEVDETLARWIQPFDLEQTPLVRSGLIKWEDRYILMIDMHHIISDGVTMGLLAEDFMKAYEGETLVAEEIQYKEYASWEREQKVNGVWEEQKTYWKQEFAGELPVLELPLDGVRSQIENNEGDRIRFEIEEGIVTGLRETMSRLGGTLFMGLMAGYSILLSKYSGQEDIVIGTPIAGRRHAELEKVAGMFVNTLAFRSYPEGEKRIEDYLLEAKHKLVQAYENQEYPFEELVEELNVKRDLSRNPLFEVILVLQNTELKEMVLSDIQIKPYAKNQNKAKFDISLNIEEVGDQLVCEMEYRSRLFRRETIEQMRKHYIKILQEISTKTEHKLNDIDLLNEEETQQLLVAYNQTLADYPREKTVIDVIDEQVNEQPNATALVYKDSFLTYGEMNRRSNQLAHYLERKGVAKGDRVAIIATHSYELVIGILATLRAGAAYVPIDPKYPSERIEYMLQDSEAKVLYTNIEIEGLSYNQELITAHDKSIEKEDPTYASKATAEDVAYIIYTSGSTGRSKGVMIEHRGLLNYIWWARKTYLKDEKEVFALYSSITFDLTITSIFTPLLSGQVIAIYEDNGEEFILDKVLKDKKVSVIKVTPAHLTLIKDQPNQSSSVKRFIVGGENLPVKLAKEVLDSFGGEVEIYNEYGPTETVVGCMIYQYRPEYDHRYSVPIGRPADNVEIYLLDKNLQLVAPGIEGELYIAGEGVARGYLNKEELTKNAFIYLNNERFHNKRMYKTGDLAKMLPDGNIEYIRRVDNQVKLRGYRIELGEIECSIGQREGVRDVVVLNRKDGSGMDYLCAYVVKEETIAIEKIKEEISQELPHYMVPAAFVEIDAIPITANGKVNRARLLEMEVTYTRENAYEAATNELEEKLIAVWEGVLGVERIGVHDNFFELGGHSLKATIVSGRIQKEVEVEIGVRDVFQYPTIKELATKISKSHQKKYEKLVPLSKQESYQVSSAQRRLYIIQMMDKENVAYNMPFALTLTGQVERVKVEQAIQQLVVKHESLRTSFHIEGEEIVQKIADKGTLTLAYKEAESQAEVDETLARWIQPFDLEQTPLVRSGLIKWEDRYILMIDMHHIISDGATMGLLAEDFMKAYEGETLVAEEIQYKEYALWERKQKVNGVWEEQKIYWKQEFAGELPVLELPLDGVRSQIENNEGDRIRFEIEEGIVTGLRETMSRLGGTLFMGLMAGYSILLSKYSGQEDIVIGTPIAGRRHAELEKVAGMFVNTLAFRSYPEGDKRIEDYLLEVKHKLVQAYENQEYPFEELVEEVNVKRDLNRNPLFDVMLVLQNTEQHELEMDGTLISHYEINRKVSQLDITLSMEEVQGKLICEMEYRSQLFRSETIEQMMKHYVKTLIEISIKTDQRLRDIEVLDKEEKEQLLNKFNDTKVEYPHEQTVIDLFEEQIKAHPSQVALVHGAAKITYEELSERVNKLAQALINEGVQVETIVALMVDRSIDMIVAILAIQKAGGAYLPIDSSYPKERIEYLLEDSECKFLLANFTKIDDLHLNYSGNILNITSLENQKIEQLHLEQRRNELTSQNLAYVIYTSGSTGKPKGVMIEHRSLSNQILGLMQDFGYENMKNHMLYSKAVFDVSVQHIFTALCSGSTLHVMTERTESDYESLYEYVIQNEVAFIDMVPAQMEQIVNNINSSSKGLRFVLGGEAFPSSLYRKLSHHIDAANIYNVYGPTETTINALIYQCDGTENKKTIPIGKPVRNYRAYILGANHELLPIGVVGELCIAGVGLARGYLNRPSLTAERFVENPNVDNERMYKTGDLVRWTHDGHIEYLGRIDHQVKIRGYRIELGEIESSISEQEGVKEVVVLNRKDASGMDYLCAYVVKEEATAIEKIKEGISQELPHYMVPGAFVEIDAIPITANGKVNRARLLEMEVTYTRENAYQAATNELEEKLVAIWEGVLGAERIGIHDNFFELGGHSLKATIVSGRIQKEVEVEIGVRDVFQYPTIKELATKISKSHQKKYEKLVPLSKQESYPVSSAQRRLYTLQMMDKENVAYNMPFALTLTGQVERVKVEQAIQQLVVKHESLRTSFHIEGEEIVQKIADKGTLTLAYKEAESQAEVDETLARWIQPFDLEQTPLVRSGLIKWEDRYILMIDMHHIISDGATMGLLAEDFMKAYEGETLVSEEIQYKEYASWEREQKVNGVWEEQKTYWKQEFAGELPVLELPLDGVRSQIENNEGDRIRFEIEEGIVTGLRETMSRLGGTLFMGLMAGYSILLSKYSGQEDIVIGTPIAGRRHAELEKVAGMFVNTLAFRSYPEGDKRIEDYLLEAKQKLVQAYENQEYPFEELVEEVNVKRDLSRNPLFEVMLVLQNTELEMMALSDIQVKPYDNNQNKAKFDINLNVEEVGDHLVCEMEYRSRLFRKETIEQMRKHYIKILQEISIKIEQRLKDIDLLDEEEKHQLLAQHTKLEYSNHELIMERFESHAASHPDKIALIYENQTMTYRELNEKANQLARYFIDHGVKKESVVGIKMNRSIDMMVVIFGILKSGASYLPIGIDTPQARIDYMLLDSECKLLITDQANEMASSHESADFQCILYGHIRDFLQDYEKTNHKIEDIRKSKAYIIYTSGSTGQPKGVVVEHDALTERMNWFHVKYMREETSGILLKTAITFDVSITELFGWIGCQGQLVVLPEGEEKNSAKIRETVIRYNVTDLNFTPSAFKVMGNELQNVASIQRIYLAGEALTKDVVQEAFRINSTLEVFNLYGPTETVIYATGTKIEKESPSITIGKPIDNVSVYILDSNQQLCPVGIIGELYISGNSLARGYLNNPELTAERFIENPYAANQRMYKTGDLVRWTHDGHIEYLGRIDHQVKIRGYRIELGEIESSISEQEGVKEVVVLNRKDASGMDYLCAYVVKEEATAIEKIKEGISQELPHYMVPGAFVEIDAIPITANGKVNRARLLEMEVTFTRENAYQAATNELEEKLVAIWEDVLGVERIGIQDNFFELGGHSLGVIKLMSTIQREFGKSLSYRDLYIDSTISKLAKKIESIEEEYANTIPVLEASELYDVSFAQRRMWIINELNPQSIAYNMPGRFVIKDTEPEEAFKATINALVMKHESFRTSFIEKDGDVFQKIEEYQAVELDIEDLMQLQEEEKYQKMLDAESLIFAQPFNLKESGLYRMKILKINVDHYEVLFCIHHIISDGVSMGIIRNEFFKYYENYKQNKRLPITPLKIQYKDFAAWQNNIIEEKMDEALHYWERKFVNFPDKLLLPERMIMDYDGNDGQYNVVIDNDLNQKIKALVSTTQISVFSLFLSSLYVLLNRMTGQDDIIIGSPVAGREHFETEEIVGCFVNTLILREKINRNERFDHFLQHVSTSVSEAVTYQAYPLELVLENLQMKYPDIQVFLNIINFSDVNELKNSSQYDFSKNVNVKFDMIFYITPLDDRILLTCEYRKTKFKNTDIQHIVGELIKVISDAASHSEKSISEIGLTTRRRLVKR